MKTKRALLLAAAVLGSSTLGAALVGTRPTSHDVVPAALGVARGSARLDAVVDEPGPVTVETVLGADWAVPLSGLLNLDSEKARAAALRDRDEPIQVYFHAIVHPTRGVYLVDTGVERALRDAPETAALSGVFAKFMHVDKLVVRNDTRSWLEARHVQPSGVFLTHLHSDHISGMRDVPNATPVYVGLGEASTRSFMHFPVRGLTDAALQGKGALQEWRFERDPDGAFDGVVDIFGDGSVWALHVPGHTRGSTAYLARTTSGPVLMTGDASHTAWGWEHDVEPGWYSEDKAKSAESLARLERFVAKHPKIQVRLGHQPLAPNGALRAAVEE